MPVHQFVHDHRLVDNGLRNYWGYNSIGFFAPHNGYASRPGQRVVNEFKTMVRALHAAGIEVILDVVYNHTAEGDHLGPTLCFRGLDNPSYYRLDPATPAATPTPPAPGTASTSATPILCSCSWTRCAIGSRKCTSTASASTWRASLARQFHEVDRLSAFFDLIHQDPVISQIKLIAEPWDLGSGGYQVGNFPVLWSEWNGAVPGLGAGLLAPAEHVDRRARPPPDRQVRPLRGNGPAPWASVNFVTAHDGFTLADLVSYNDKHNEANGEANVDGTDDNRSWNCGSRARPTTPTCWP